MASRGVSAGSLGMGFEGEGVIKYIRPAIFENRIQAEGHHAWLASITNLGDG